MYLSDYSISQEFLKELLAEEAEELTKAAKISW